MKLVILHCTYDHVHQNVIVTFLKRKLNYFYVNCLGEKVYVACGFLIFLFFLEGTMIKQKRICGRRLR